MKTIHTVGDSHCLHAWRDLDLPGWRVVTHHLGARLMYTFGIRGNELVDLHTFGLLPGDALAFSFGEIDCRAHAHTRGLGGLAVAYIDRIEGLTAGLPPCTIAVMGIVPPQRDPLPIHAGSATERRAYVRTLNRDVEARAYMRGWRFLDVYGAYCDGEGFMSPALVGTRGHIGVKGPLEELVKEALW